LAWGEFGFAGRLLDREGRENLAIIEWTDDGLQVTHGIRGGRLTPSRRSDRWDVLRPNVPFSPGYGLQDG
jgi:hypothetical protein